MSTNLDDADMEGPEAAVFCLLHVLETFQLAQAELVRWPRIRIGATDTHRMAADLAELIRAIEWRL